MIKLAAFDIDRTLIPEHSATVDPQTIEAILELKNKGIKVVIASGRQWQHLPEILMSMDFDYFVLINGSVITDAQGHILHKETFSVGKAEQLVRDARCRGRDIYFRFEAGLCAAEEAVRRQGGTPFGQLIRELPPALRASFLEKNPLEWGETPVAGLLSLSGEDARWLAQRHPDLDFIRVMGGGICDVNVRGVSKSTGVERVCAMEGIGMENVIAFGDDRNDMEMLRDAGIGVGMGNGDEAALAAADYVTDSCEKLGVVNALKHFGLIG